MNSSALCLSLPSAALGDSPSVLRVRSGWRRGPAADSGGPFLLSYTEFTPDTLRDVPAIYRAARRLRREITELEGAVGVTVYWQLLRGRGGSVSAWADESALRRFVSLPFHVETMRAYRPRGSLRAIDWTASSLELGAAFRDGQRGLDEGRGQTSRRG